MKLQLVLIYFGFKESIVNWFRNSMWCIQLHSLQWSTVWNTKRSQTRRSSLPIFIYIVCRFVNCCFKSQLPYSGLTHRKFRIFSKLYADNSTFVFRDDETSIRQFWTQLITSLVVLVSEKIVIKPNVMVRGKTGWKINYR